MIQFYPIFINYDLFLSNFIHFHPIISIFIHFHSISILIHYNPCHIFSGNSTSISATLDQRRFRSTEETIDDEHTTSYYGGEIYNNSLYVVAPEEGYTSGYPSNDNYGYLPTPPPPPPPQPPGSSRFMYPEHAGHLV